MNNEELLSSNVLDNEHELLNDFLQTFADNNFQVLSFNYADNATVPYVLLNINDQRDIDFIEKMCTEDSTNSISFFGNSYGFNRVGLYSTAELKEDFFKKMVQNLKELSDDTSENKPSSIVSKLFKLSADKTIFPPIEYNTSESIPSELESIYLQEIENSLQRYEPKSCIDQIKEDCNSSTKGLTSIKAIDAKFKSLFLRRRPTEDEIIACTQVLQLLNNVDKEYYYKLPLEIIDLLERISLQVYQYFDDKAQFKKSDLAEAILCYINLEYWSNDEEIQDLTSLYENNDLEIKRKQEQDTINNSQQISNNQNSSMMQLTVVDNKNILLKLLDKIVSFIKNFSGNTNKEKAHF